MALKTVHYDVKALNYYLAQTGCCGEVGICLPADPWSSRTVTGLPFILATVQNSGRYLGSGGSPFPPSFENPRCEDLYEYILVYDDAQFITNPQTQQPFFITCDDIGDIISACLVNYFISLL